MEPIPTIDVRERADSLVWLGTFWSRLGGEHFMLCGLGKALSSDSRLDWSDMNEIRDESIDYLASTPWGALVLNCPQQYYWIQDYPISKTVWKRSSFIAILKSVTEFWGLYEELGNRFFVGANSGLSFQHCRPLATHVLALCFRAQSDEKQKEVLHANLAQLCRESRIVEKLSSNDEYWLRICERSQLDDEES
jgi:hypothetical protein